MEFITTNKSTESSKSNETKEVKDAVNKCNICMEELDASKIYSLECSSLHIFCQDCIIKWYCTCIDKNVYVPNDKIYACPICRQFGGFTLIKGMCEESYVETTKTYQTHSLMKCLCKHDSGPYGESKYCLNRLDAESDTPTEKLGAILEFSPEFPGVASPSIERVGICQNHYQQFLDGKKIYHYFKKEVVKSEKLKVIPFPKSA